jgi:23S rRNA pseudouridine1911/1915/1917 synthase
MTETPTGSAISIIYQDHDLLIVNKPAGIVIHPTYKHADDTLWDAILTYLQQQECDDWQPEELSDDPRWARAPEHVRVMLREKRRERQWKEQGLLARPALLHRLDKDTSGIVALARTEVARTHMIRQFYAHTITKRYLTVVQRVACAWSRPRATFKITKRNQGNETLLHDAPASLMPNDEYILNGPLCRDTEDRRRCIVGPGGQDATTIIKVLDVSEDDTLILLEAYPVTGRMHQIRAHLAALGYTMIGDQMYAPLPESGTPQAALQRQFLHAYSLRFQRYPDNVVSTFVAPLADDLVTWMNRYFPAGLGALYQDV